jgi:hypothetical protein
MEKCIRVAAVLVLASSFCACKKLKEIREGPGGPLPSAEDVKGAAGVEGEYSGYGTTPYGTSYRCDVTVARKGDAYVVTWYLEGKVSYKGTGILKDDTLVVGYAAPEGYGVVAYEVKADGSLEGEWAAKGGSKAGTETLKRKK